MPTEQFLNSLVFNKVDSSDTLEAMDSAGLINENEFYLVEEDDYSMLVDKEPTKDSKNLVTSGGVYNAIYDLAADIITPETIKAVPVERTINEKALSEDIVLTPEDIGARADTWLPTPAEIKALKVYGSLAELDLTEATATPEAIVSAMALNSILLHQTGEDVSNNAYEAPASWGLLKVIKNNDYYTSFEYQISSVPGILYLWKGYFNLSASTKWSGWSQIASIDYAVPVTRKINNKALSADITLAAADVNAVPTTRKVNNKALSADITLAAADVGAVPTTRTVNGKALSANITLSASDVGAAPTQHTHAISDITNLQTTLDSLGGFTYGTTAPTNTKLLWIDTTATTGGLKYYNGSGWVHVPVAYT